MLLSASDQKKLEDEFARRLAARVQIELDVDDSEPSLRSIELLGELSALSPLLSYRVERRSGRAHLPSLALSGAALGEIRFTGLPTGYEFPTFIDAVIGVSRGEAELGAASRELIASLATDRHLKVFTTPT